jgi:hypothetical protein
MQFPGSPSQNTAYTLTALPDTLTQGQPITASGTVTSGGANTKDWIGLCEVGASSFVATFRM